MDSWLKKANYEANKMILVKFLKEIYTWDRSSIFFDALVCITERTDHNVDEAKLNSITSVEGGLECHSERK